MKTKEITIFKIFGLITLLASLPFFFMGGFTNPVSNGLGLTLFCLSNALFRLALKSEYELTDAVVSVLAKIHRKELEKFIKEKQKEIEEKKKVE